MTINKMIRIRTTRLAIASGFLRSLRIPSLKKVVDSLITSCCFFSSSVAFSNLCRSICMENGLFFGIFIESIFESISFPLNPA